MAPRDAAPKKSASLSKNINKQVHFQNNEFEPEPTTRRSTPYPARESSGSSHHAVNTQHQTAQDRQPLSQPEGISTFPPFDSDTPLPTGGQQIFTHHTTGPQPGLFTSNFAAANLSQPTCHVHQQPRIAVTASVPIANYPDVGRYFNMGDYENTGTYDQGVHFQPQVPDTSFGPQVHTYVPRHDNSVVYVQQVAYPVPTVAPMQSAQIAVPIQQVPVGTIPVVVPGAVPPTPIVFQQPVTQPAMMHVPVTNNMGHIPTTTAFPIQQAPGGFPTSVGGMPIHFGQALGIGQTASEVIMQHAQFAQENNLFEPQDFKPADDDPSRIYMCRELDGNWTQRTRYTIDNIGCRWYLTDEGYFYAVRLPN